MSVAAAMAAVQVVSTVVGAVSEASNLRGQARTLDENARLTQLRGEEEVAATYREVRQVTGQGAASLAESGVLMGTGSAADVLRESVFQAELDVARTRQAAAGEAASLRQQADDARKAARGALIQGALGALGAGLSYKMGQDDKKRLATQRANERWSERTVPRTDTPRVNIGARPITPMSSGSIAAATRGFGVVQLPGGR